MAEDREIRQRVRVDNQASDELRQIGDDTREMGEATQQAGDQAEQASGGQEQYSEAARRTGDASQQAAGSANEYAGAAQEAGDATASTSDEMDEQTNVLGRLGDSLGVSISRWDALAAVLAVVGGMLKDVADAGRDADQATRDAAPAMGDLVANIGADRAAATRAQINQLATDQRLGVEGRAALHTAAVRITDLEGDITDQELTAQLTDLAQLARVAGPEQFQGDQAVDLIRQVQERTGIGHRQAMMAASRIIHGPLGERDATELLDRTGQEGLALALAAAPHTARPEAFARRLPTIRQRLRDMSPEDRAALGLAEDPDFTGDLAAIAAGVSAGDIAREEAIDAMGGERMRGAIDPLLTVMEDPSRLREIERTLLDPTHFSQVQRQLRRSPEVRAAERARAEELELQLRDEESSLARFGELSRQMQHQLDTLPPGFRLLGGLPFAADIAAGVVHPFVGEEAIERRTPGGGQGIPAQPGPDAWQWPDAEPAPPTDDAGAMLGGGGRTLTQINIRNQYNGREDPAWADVEPRIGMG